MDAKITNYPEKGIGVVWRCMKDIHIQQTSKLCHDTEYTLNLFDRGK